MFYQSVTTWDFDWQGSDGWLLQVTYGQFSTITEAANFGKSVNLLHPQNEDYLLLEENRNHYFIGDLSSTKLLKLKEEVKTRVDSFHSYLIDEGLNVGDHLEDERLITYYDDYERISLTIDDLKSFPTSFSSSSYGVIDHQGYPVELPTIEPKTEEKRNYPLFAEAIELLTAYCQTYFQSFQANLGHNHYICASIYDYYDKGILVAIHLNLHYHQGIQVKPITELVAAIRDLLSNLDAATEGFFLFSNGLIDQRPVANIYYLRSSLKERFTEHTARSDAKTAISLLEPLTT